MPPRFCLLELAPLKCQVAQQIESSIAVSAAEGFIDQAAEQARLALVLSLFEPFLGLTFNSVAVKSQGIRWQRRQTLMAQTPSTEVMGRVEWEQFVAGFFQDMHILVDGLGPLLFGYQFVGGCEPVGRGSALARQRQTTGHDLGRRRS